MSCVYFQQSLPLFPHTKQTFRCFQPLRSLRQIDNRMRSYLTKVDFRESSTFVWLRVDNFNCVRLRVEDERMKSIHAFRIDTLHRHLQIYHYKVCAVERVIREPFFFISLAKFTFFVLCRVNLNTEKLCRSFHLFSFYRHLFLDIHANAKQIYFLFSTALLFNLTLKHSWITIQLLNRKYFQIEYLIDIDYCMCLMRIHLLRETWFVSMPAVEFSNLWNFNLFIFSRFCLTYIA